MFHIDAAVGEGEGYDISRLSPGMYIYDVTGCSTGDDT